MNWGGRIQAILGGRLNLDFIHYRHAAGRNGSWISSSFLLPNFHNRPFSILMAILKVYRQIDVSCWPLPEEIEYIRGPHGWFNLFQFCLEAPRESTPVVSLFIF
jgi:hypothetical protein